MKGVATEPDDAVLGRFHGNAIVILDFSSDWELEVGDSLAMRTLIHALTITITAVLAAQPIAHTARVPHTDAVLEWNAIMVATVRTENPFSQGRLAAITQLAVFEAVNAITGRYAPYVGTLTAPADTSPEAAVAAAAHTVLTAYLPSATATLDAARASSLARIADGPARDNGIAVGEAAAAAVIANRSGDGATPPEFHLPATADPGEWQPTTGCPPAGGVLKHWARLAPFGIESADQFRSPAPPALTSGRYTRDFNEVKEVGDVNSLARPQHKTDLARFYNAVLAVGTWNPAVAQVAAARRTRLDANARMFALLNMAISDGLVAVMDTKYHYTVWRPVTAIHEADRDDNPRTAADPAFQPLVGTPCFPSYGSAHAAASNAARQIAEAFFDDGDVDVRLSDPAIPGLVLEYTSFEEITQDIDDARVYGGIHFRFDQLAGRKQGREIGRWVLKHNLRPLR
jgi:hypothetical protein